MMLSHRIFIYMIVLVKTLLMARLFSQTTTDSNVVYMYLSNNSGGTAKAVPQGKKRSSKPL